MTVCHPEGMDEDTVPDPQAREQPTTVDMLYLDMEHFVLTTESRPPLEPRARVVPIGGPRFRFFPREGFAGSKGESA